MNVRSLLVIGVPLLAMVALMYAFLPTARQNWGRSSMLERLVLVSLLVVALLWAAFFDHRALHPIFLFTALAISGIGVLMKRQRGKWTRR
jgi:RsiW-degrading membrane proteinase PrsW (M82 family)